MKLILPLGLCLLARLPLAGQDQEPVVSKDAVSVHTVERGDMPLFEQATGSITSLHPSRAVLALSGSHAGQCQVGRSAKIQIDPSPKGIEGKVVNGSKDACEIEMSDTLPEDAALGSKASGLIQVGEMKDVVYFARPKDSAANGVATLFVMDADSAYARRTQVKYGAISGPLIQIADGLKPGDRVIVTDISKWADYPRLRLQ